MSARELAVTILGLVGTFCLPWPGEPEPGDASAHEEIRAIHPGKSRDHAGKAHEERPQLAGLRP